MSNKNFHKRKALFLIVITLLVVIILFLTTNKDILTQAGESDIYLCTQEDGTYYIQNSQGDKIFEGQQEDSAWENIRSLEMLDRAGLLAQGSSSFSLKAGCRTLGKWALRGLAVLDLPDLIYRSENERPYFVMAYYLNELSDRRSLYDKKGFDKWLGDQGTELATIWDTQFDSWGIENPKNWGTEAPSKSQIQAFLKLISTTCPDCYYAILYPDEYDIGNHGTDGNIRSFIEDINNLYPGIEIPDPGEVQEYHIAKEFAKNNPLPTDSLIRATEESWANALEKYEKEIGNTKKDLEEKLAGSLTGEEIDIIINQLNKFKTIKDYYQKIIEEHKKNQETWNKRKDYYVALYFKPDSRKFDPRFIPDLKPPIDKSKVYPRYGDVEKESSPYRLKNLLKKAWKEKMFYLRQRSRFGGDYPKIYSMEVQNRLIDDIQDKLFDLTGKSPLEGQELRGLTDVNAGKLPFAIVNEEIKLAKITNKKEREAGEFYIKTLKDLYLKIAGKEKYIYIENVRRSRIRDYLKQGHTKESLFKILPSEWRKLIEEIVKDESGKSILPYRPKNSLNE